MYCRQHWGWWSECVVVDDQRFCCSEALQGKVWVVKRRSGRAEGASDLWNKRRGWIRSPIQD